MEEDGGNNRRDSIEDKVIEETAIEETEETELSECGGCLTDVGRNGIV